LQVRHNTSLLGVEHAVAQTLVDVADLICSHCKATLDRIDIEISLA
jgi:organic hydroperoxide reductase OsmC/OhrA